MSCMSTYMYIHTYMTPQMLNNEPKLPLEVPILDQSCYSNDTT